MKLFSASSSSCSISSILRQLLCFNTASLPENTQMNFNNSFHEKVVNKENSPGIVARLMGLESIPNTRVETTTSSTMNDAPSRKYDNVNYFLLEHEEEFIVISFEDESKRKSEKRRRRKGTRSNGKRGRENVDPNKEGESSAFVGESKIQELGEVVCGTENSEFSIERGMGVSSTSVCCEKYKNGRKNVKGLNSTNVEEKHGDFENSSPVSVLDDLQFYTDARVEAESGLGGGCLILGSLNSRKKLPIELGNSEKSSLSKPVIDLEKNNLIRYAEARQENDSGEILEQMLRKICRMAQGDVRETSSTYKQLWKLEDIEDISKELELQIVGRLLDELVDQLIDLSHMDIL